MFGLSMFGDGAILLHRPLINILGAGVHNHAALLEIADCTGHVAQGYKKDAEYIAKFFIPHMARLDKEKKRYVTRVFNFLLLYFIHYLNISITFIIKYHAL